MGWTAFLNRRNIGKLSFTPASIYEFVATMLIRKSLILGFEKPENLIFSFISIRFWKIIWSKILNHIQKPLLMQTEKRLLVVEESYVRFPIILFRGVFVDYYTLHPCHFLTGAQRLFPLVFHHRYRIPIRHAVQMWRIRYHYSMPACKVGYRR